jgi:60 kDa SS-A/Ro ribonucleoprotein
MANKNLFKSLVGKLIPATNALNEERAPAYLLSPKAQLAQYAATGCLNSTFYASADEQLARVIELCADIDAEFIARVAVFCRERGYMKDMPALLCAVLSVKDRALLARIFPRVIDNARMLRTFVQIVRLGVVGRAGHCACASGARVVRRRDPAAISRHVGQNPSLADIVKMVHQAKDAEREALFGYFIGQQCCRRLAGSGASV